MFTPRTITVEITILASTAANDIICENKLLCRFTLQLVIAGLIEQCSYCSPARNNNHLYCHICGVDSTILFLLSTFFYISYIK